MSNGSLEYVKKMIKALVVPQQNGLTAIGLNNDYIEQEGVGIPYQNFGANSLFEFLCSITDTLTLGTNRAGEQVFFVRVDSSVAHIANFVAHQKPQPIKRRTGISRPEIEKRPYREASDPPHQVPSHQPLPSTSSTPSASRQFSPERNRNNDSHRGGSNSSTSGSSQRREPEFRSGDREAERRRRDPSPMDISPPPQRSASPEPDRFRNPSPPRHGRSHSFRDTSPSRSRRYSAHVTSPRSTHSPPFDFDRELSRARERRGLPPSSRSRRSRTRSPSPRRSRRRPSPSPPRRRSPQTKSQSCQTEKDKTPLPPQPPPPKKVVSTSCQTEPEAKDDQRKTRTGSFGDDNGVDLNAIYYGPSAEHQSPYNGFSMTPIYDPCYEEDKDNPGHYYDFDAGVLRPIPLIPEWYAHWMYSGWVDATGAVGPPQPVQKQPQQQSQQQSSQHQYQQQHHQQQHQPQQQQQQHAFYHQQATLPSNPVNSPPQTRVIPTTPTANTATRDPRLARARARAAQQAQSQPQQQQQQPQQQQQQHQAPQQSTERPPTTPPRRKRDFGEYMKARKLSGSSGGDNLKK